MAIACSYPEDSNLQSEPQLKTIRMALKLAIMAVPKNEPTVVVPIGASFANRRSYSNFLVLNSRHK